LRRKPGHSGARALESLARLALGDEAGARRLLDYTRFVSVSPISVPAGFANLEQFNAALSEHCLTHPTLVGSPLSHATAGGLHSGSLLTPPRGPITALTNAVSAATNAYARQLTELDADHPVIRFRPRSVFLRTWCVVLERGGHQIPHIHPEAWLSGVYYPQIPSALAHADTHAGCLEFGEPDAHFPTRLTPPSFRVTPRAGRLVLFPSYFYHRTVPFETAGTRISIAFDFAPLS
jgi:uncharacterized protein (TIGR02466 family)